MKAVRNAVSALVLAACAFAPIATQAKDGKGKTVHITLKNRTATSMDVMVDDKPVTIAANSEYELNAPEGTVVYGADKSVKVRVTKELNGTATSFR